MKKFMLIALCFAIQSNFTKTEENQLEWNWEAGIPHYPHPRYSNDDEILFFPRIIGGVPAFFGEFLAKISIQTRRGSHFCGGSLIDPRHVLTAGHCLTTPDGRVFDPFDIRLVGDDLSIKIFGSRTRQIRFVTHIFVHSDYNSQTFKNDIAIVRISVPFFQTPTLRAMPRSRLTPNPGDVCQLAGWGVTHEKLEKPNPILLRVEIDIISMEFCNGTDSYNGNIPSNTICAGSLDGSRDACFGDSGGGLICNSQIAGVVSFGFGCGRSTFPGIYTDVSRYNAWIDECTAFNLHHENISTPRTNQKSAGKLLSPTKFLFLMIAASIKILKCLCESEIN